MNHVFSPIESFQGSNGYQQWESTLTEQCGAFHSEPPLSKGIDTFKGAILPARVSGSGYAGAQIGTNCPHIHRGVRDIKRDGQDFLYIVHQIAGTAIMDHIGIQSKIEPGDLILLDSSRPSDFYFSGMSEQISLIIPRHKLETNLQNCKLMLNQKISATSRIGAVAGMITRQFFDNEDMDDELEDIMEALITLVRPRLTCSEIQVPSYNEKLQKSSFEKAKRHIEANLTDFELTPETIASDLGTSKRTLHRIFAHHGLSIGRYILDRRLDRCASEFETESDIQKISAVAFAWGFNDVSHFSRAFKARFGASPRDFRNRILCVQH